MCISDSQRIRVIRAIIGMDSKTFAAELCVSAGTLTAWEKGRSTPQPQKRHELAKLCQKHGLCFMPSGFPVPASDCLIFKERKETHAS